MSEPNEELDKDSEFYIFDVFDRTKPKNKEALYALKRYFDKHDEMTTECFKDHDTRIHRLTRDVYSLNLIVEHLKTELESMIPKPLEIDTSKVPNEWRSNRAFNRRWPWIEIDQSSSIVKCKRCGASELCSGFSSSYSDNFQWFVNTHGACPDPKKKETS